MNKINYRIKRVDTSEYLVSGSGNSGYQYWDKYPGFAFEYVRKDQAERVLGTLPKNIECIIEEVIR